MSLKNARIACTALAQRIMLGNISANGLDFIGTPKDVTSDCLKAVIDFVGNGNTATVTAGGKPAYEITVKAIDTRPAADVPVIQVQEPVAWKLGFALYLTKEQAFADVRNPDLHPIPLYAAPQQSNAPALTDADLFDILKSIDPLTVRLPSGFVLVRLFDALS